jgi:hypothetical protein
MFSTVSHSICISMDGFRQLYSRSSDTLQLHTEGLSSEPPVVFLLRFLTDYDMTFNGINQLQIMQIELYDLYVVDFVSVCGVSNREFLDSGPILINC